MAKWTVGARPATGERSGAKGAVTLTPEMIRGCFLRVPIMTSAYRLLSLSEGPETGRDQREGGRDMSKLWKMLATVVVVIFSVSGAFAQAASQKTTKPAAKATATQTSAAPTTPTQTPEAKETKAKHRKAKKAKKAQKAPSESTEPKKPQ